MAVKTRTYLPTDWQLWNFVTTAGTFVLDFSELDGTDVLGTSVGTMTVSTDELTGFEITQGGTPTQGIFNDFTPIILNATLRFKDFTPAVANRYLVNTPIWLSLKNEQTVDDPTLGKRTLWFKGFIDSFTSESSPDSEFTTVSITATSKGAVELNQLITITQSSSSEMGAQIYSAALSQGITLGITKDLLSAGTYQFPTVATPQVRMLGEWLDNFSIAYSRQLYESMIALPADASGVVTYSQEIRNQPTFFSSNATFTDDEISNITFDWIGAESPTAVDLTLYSNSATLYQYGNTNSQIGGSVYTATIDVANLTQLTAIGQAKLFHNKKYLPATITVKTAETNQTISFKEEVSGATSSWVNVDNFGLMADNITIDSTTFGVNEEMRVVGRTITVTPDIWTTTYNLWKAL